MHLKDQNQVYKGEFEDGYCHGHGRLLFQDPNQVIWYDIPVQYDKDQMTPFSSRLLKTLCNSTRKEEAPKSKLDECRLKVFATLAILRL